jgi:hypothetical protein
MSTAERVTTSERDGCRRGRRAWINLRAMFVYGSDFSLLKPVACLACIGVLLTVALSFGNIDVDAFTLSLN